MLKRPAILFAWLLIAAALVFGLVRLFELRLGQGDLYPPYSTLRADPLGASVLYESLERVPHAAARRCFEAEFKDDTGRGKALFVLGARPYSVHWLSRSEFETMQRFVFNGGRVVIAYFPEVTETWSSRLARTNETNQADSSEPSGGKKSQRHSRKESVTTDENRNGSETNAPASTNSVTGTKSVTSTNQTELNGSEKREKHSTSRRSRRSRHREDQEEDDESKEELRRYVRLTEKWGFQFEYKNLGTNESGRIQFPDAKLVLSSPDLPAILPIHTALCFTNLTNGWTTVYRRDKKTPVIVERKFGAGSVVLVADSYPFSNEAMFKNRSAPLLAWFLGGGRDAIFDEAHLGVVEQTGMATLMRRYRLHGLIFGLLVLVALFVWKNSQSLVPPHAEVESKAGPVVLGRDSVAGFVNLLRRGIKPAEILNVCFAEWKKSGARIAAVSPAQRAEVERLVQYQAGLEPHQRKPVANYRVICQILQRRK